MRRYLIVVDHKHLYRWYKDPLQNFNSLNIGMMWSRTPQGVLYWQDIYDDCWTKVISNKELMKAKQNVKKILFEYWTGA